MRCGQGDDQLLVPERKTVEAVVGDRAADERGVEPSVGQPGQPFADGEGLQLHLRARRLPVVGVEDPVEPLAEAGPGPAAGHGGAPVRSGSGGGVARSCGRCAAEVRRP